MSSGVQAIPDGYQAITLYLTVKNGGALVEFLEDNYQDDMTSTKGVDIAIKALNAAMRRDSASGNGYDIVVINEKGWNPISQAEITKRKEKLNIK